MRTTFLLVASLLIACGPGARHNGDDDDGPDSATCQNACSVDGHAIVDCHNNVVTQCEGAAACDPATFTCADACTAAESNHRSVGCDYYATDMDSLFGGYCYAVFVANTWTSPAHINVDYKGQQLNVATFTRIPSGSGPTLTQGTFDPAAGLAPGQVAILFLGGTQGAAPNCPVTPAAAAPSLSGTGISDAFHIKTDVPVVAYQINPYGGGSVAVTAASLLLPTSVWDQEYVAVNVSAASAGNPSMNIVAKEDGTTVTLTPNAALSGAGGIPSGAAGSPVTINLNKGQHAQITQATELTGSTVQSNKPVGFMAGHTCMNMPVGTSYCDHGEQMVAPVQALGSRYVGVMYRPRVAQETGTYWRVIGAVDGTQLTYSTNVGGPTTLAKGQQVLFQTGTPFTVESQDNDHPFMLFTYMTSSNAVSDGYGDPDFVTSVPPEQYLQNYVFFTDPTYPETNIVMVRARSQIDNNFHDVMLDCAGPITGWQPIGNGEYEYARKDLMTGNFTSVGTCSTGRHEIKSDAPFGLWVWGWGTPLTSTFTANVSYGYPGGMNVSPINSVIL
ncbi:MAG TPA: IgGFc-binding protein [Kofleriaceae bacterium]|nr:IgGFc-binding protein [Kofleriaceae bacterium]